MHVTTADLPPLDLYRLLTGAVVPRPIAWVSTLGADGVSNLAPYSFFTVASCQPPVLLITHVNPGNGIEKDTLRNLRETGDCVVNTVSEDDLERMNASCAPYPAGISEFERAGIEAVESRLVAAPGVASAHVRMECRLRELRPIAQTPMAGQLLLLDVLGIEVADEVLREGLIDPIALAAMGKLGGDAYSAATPAHSLPRPRLDD